MGFMGVPNAAAEIKAAQMKVLAFPVSNKMGGIRIDLVPPFPPRDVMLAPPAEGYFMVRTGNGWQRSSSKTPSRVQVPKADCFGWHDHPEEILRGEFGLRIVGRVTATNSRDSSSNINLT